MLISSVPENNTHLASITKLKKNAGCYGATVKTVPRNRDVCHGLVTSEDYYNGQVLSGLLEDDGGHLKVQTEMVLGLHICYSAKQIQRNFLPGHSKVLIPFSTDVSLLERTPWIDFEPATSVFKA